ncbi:MAG: hypothetical protein PHN56_06405, partial [Candidatus Nanoarchaeia archaeon]|nr:hypothetical protein [Candidatus Nanoarchaeia archaeon]
MGAPVKNDYSKYGKILELLKSSAFSAHTDIVCITVSKNLNSVEHFRNFVDSLIDSNDAMVSSMGKTTITILFHERFLEQAKNFFGKEILNINIKVGAIYIKCPKEVNNTPGITAFISSLFSDKNIAIIEMIASYTDYTIVVNEKDTYT